MNKVIKRIIKEELSGERAKAHVQRISEFHRIQASPMFHQAAEYVRDTLLQLGFADAEIEQFPSDGSRKYGTYVSPIGWEVKNAELRIVEPEEKVLVQYATVPTGLHVHSKSTSKEGVVTELVEVGVGTKTKDYEGRDVRGKFVLATGRARWVHEQAVHKYGAAGVITDSLADEFRGIRDSMDVPDAHSYQSIWPSREDLEKVTFGFSINKRQGNYLRTLLQSNKEVKLKAKVEAQLFESKLDVVSTTIPGSSMKNEEVFLISHLCHPRVSANDNASGSGLLLEIARTLQTLIASKKLERPKRTIRFLWVPESIGTIAFLNSHPDFIGRAVAGLNLDMVGEDQEICKSTLVLDRTPDSLPSFLSDFVFELVRESIEMFDPSAVFGFSSTFRFREGAFTGGSDHAEFVDSTVKVPCVMLLQWPDLFYHSSMDTIDKVSSSSLRRVGWIAAVAIQTLADASADDAMSLANLTLERGLSRIRRAGVECIQDLTNIRTGERSKEGKEEKPLALSKVFESYKHKLKHLVWREEEAIRSVKKLGTSPRLDSFITRLLSESADCEKKELAKVEEVLSFILEENQLEIPMKMEETDCGKKAGRLIPQRLHKGTLSTGALKRGFAEEEYDWYEEMVGKEPEFRSKLAEMINFMDGKRTLLDIVRAVSAEYGELNVEDALRLLKNLKAMGLVSTGAT